MKKWFGLAALLLLLLMAGAAHAAEEQWVKSFTVKAGNDRITVSWNSFGKAHKGSYRLYWAYAKNPYYSYQDITDGSNQYSFAAAPGVKYKIALYYNPYYPTFPGYDIQYVKNATAKAATKKPFSFTTSTKRLGFFNGSMKKLMSTPTSKLKNMTSANKAEFYKKNRLLYYMTTWKYNIKKKTSFLMTLTLKTPEGWIYVNQGTVEITPSKSSKNRLFDHFENLLQSYQNWGDATFNGKFTVKVYIGGYPIDTKTFTMKGSGKAKTTPKPTAKPKPTNTPEPSIALNGATTEKTKITMRAGNSLKIAFNGLEEDTRYDTFQWTILSGSSCISLLNSDQATCTIAALNTGTVTLRITYRFGLEGTNYQTGDVMRYYDEKTKDYTITIIR